MKEGGNKSRVQEIEQCLVSVGSSSRFVHWGQSVFPNSKEFLKLGKNENIPVMIPGLN